MRKLVLLTATALVIAACGTASGSNATDLPGATDQPNAISAVGPGMWLRMPCNQTPTNMCSPTDSSTSTKTATRYSPRFSPNPSPRFPEARTPGRRYRSRRA